MQLYWSGLLVSPASSSWLVSIVTDEDHSSTDNVDDGEKDEVNEVNQELCEKKKQQV